MSHLLLSSGAVGYVQFFFPLSTDSRARCIKVHLTISICRHVVETGRVAVYLSFSFWFSPPLIDDICRSLIVAVYMYIGRVAGIYKLKSKWAHQSYIDTGLRWALINNIN